MKQTLIALLALCLTALTACEKEEPESYPVTMRFNRIVPTSDYLFFIGGRKIEDRARMERFRDAPHEILPVGGPPENIYWEEPSGAEFDRIDFPDREHFRMLWAKGGEDRFDVVRHDDMLVMAHPEQSEWMSSLIFDLLRYREGNVDRLHTQIGMIHWCLWGRFLSERRFEMEWMQYRIRSERYVISDEMGEYSNNIDLSKIDRMRPGDTILVRHYKVIFTR